MVETPVDQFAAQVAREVMGWEKDSGDGYWWCHGDAETVSTETWDPAARWDHAGMVVEKLTADGHTIQLTIGAKTALCYGFVESLPASDKVRVKALTAPQAISLCAVEIAALAARERGEGAP
jgi:hypothetical protein